jgi:hypothetical protein
MTTTSQTSVQPSLGRDLALLLRARPGAAIAVVQALALLAGGGLGAVIGPLTAEPARTLSVPSRPYRPIVSTLKPFVTAQVLAGPPVEAATNNGRAILQALMVKAGLRPDFELSRLTGAQAQQLNALLPLAGLPPEPAQPFRLSIATKDGRQALHCLTQAAYYEAGASGPQAQAAVVQVVLNRVRHPNFPKSVCGVVYEGSARASGCQFTFTCDGALGREVDAAAWAAAQTVAARALGGYVVPEVGASTYYHAAYVFPAWAPAFVKRAAVGPHIFYSLTGQAGQAAALNGRYAGGETSLSPAVLNAIDILTQKPGTGGARRPEPEAAPPGRIHMQLAMAPAAAPVAAPVEAPRAVVAEAPALSAPHVLAISTDAPSLALPVQPERQAATPRHAPDPFARR